MLLHWSRRDHRLLHRRPLVQGHHPYRRFVTIGAAARQPLCCIFRKTRYNREYLRLEEFRHDCHCDRRALTDVRLAHPGPVRSRRARGCVRESVDRSPRRFCKPWRGAVRPSADEEYEAALLALCREVLEIEGEKPVLLPVGAKTLAMVSRSRDAFSAVAGLCAATPSQLTFFNDKAAVSALAKTLGVPVPESFERQPEEADEPFFLPRAASLRGQAALR